MTFLAQLTSKTLLKLQKSHLTYQSNCIVNRINLTSKEMQAYEDEWQTTNTDDSIRLEDQPYYIQLQRMSEIFESQQESINQQITLLEAEINTFDSLIKNGIKDSCSLTLLGGS